jgi:pimeloyl-ACP methyl ester carboxylesterase
VSSSRNGLIGLGVGLGVAGAATAAGVVADRMHRRRQDALETGVSLVEKPSREVVVEATDGVALHVEVDEPRSGVALDEHGLPRPTVVMSHGYCLTSECWVFQRRYLRWAGHRVVVWDQRGHGRSGRGVSSSYTIAQLGQDLASVITAVAPDGPLVLVGHSMGGMTTMALGTIQPDLVRDRVVAFGAISTSAGGMPLASGGFAASAGRLLLERLGPGVAGVFEHRPELLKGILSANSQLAEFLVERYSFASPVPRSVVKLASKMLLGTNLTVMSSFTPAFDDYDQTGGLAAYDGCETLVFNGEQDVLTPPEHSERIVRALPGAQHVIVRDAGHVIMLEHPDLLNQQLDAMIERAAKREEEHIPADLVPRVRRVVTDVDKRRRIERGLERIDRAKDDDQPTAPRDTSAGSAKSTARERRREAS